MERAAGISPPRVFTAPSLAFRLRAGCPAARPSMHILSSEVVVIMQDGSSLEAVGHSSSATMDPAREKCQPERTIAPEIIVIASRSLRAIDLRRFPFSSIIQRFVIKPFLFAPRLRNNADTKSNPPPDRCVPSTHRANKADRRVLS